MHARRTVSLLSLLLLAVGSACARYRPARFAARPPVADAHDDGPIPVPKWRWIPEPVYLSEVYLHRPLREALDLSARPESTDVNSFDEVPRSTWYAPPRLDIGSMARGPDTLGPPRPPFTVLPDAPMGYSSGAFSISDSRGYRYEIAVDVQDRPEMRTAAAAICARLVWALGVPTPPVFIIKVSAEDFWRSEGSTVGVDDILKSGPPPVLGYYRVAALSWEPGVLLAYAPETGVRGDDPNDLIAHENRRTMRALKVYASWIALDGLGPSKTVDRYVGAPGEGHVVHYFVGLDEALGANAVVRVSDPPPGEGGGSPFMRLLTLGLAPNPAPSPTQIEVPAVGEFDSDVDPGGFAPPLPYEPADRLQAPDGYWAAKRIAPLSSAHIALAIEAGKISDRRAHKAIQAALEARRKKVLAYWFDRVTPIELLTVAGSKVALRDEAVHWGLVPPDRTDYRIDFLASGGEKVSAPIVLHPRGETMELTLPQVPLDTARDYLVMQITARRGKRMLPRAFELHLKMGGDKLVVLGIRH